MSQDILITPGSGEPQILFRGSGTTDTAVELNVLSSYQSATGSGTALLFEGEEGLLFGVTDNLSSGTIFSVSDISGLTAIEYDASGDLKLGEYANSTTLYADRGVYLATGIPTNTTNAVYISGGALHFNGSTVGGYDDAAISGYFESRVDQADSDIATVSGLLYDDAAISGYFESRVDQADSDIATVSGLLYDDAAISGYFESRVDQNAADIVTVSGLAGGSSYAAGSGLTLVGTEFNVYGGSGNFQQIDLTSDNTFIPKMVFTGSGVTDTPIRMKVLSSHASASTSGTALAFEGTEGQLFGITDNLSSGTIFSVNDITGLPAISYDASGDLKIGEFASSTTLYTSRGVYLSSGIPAITTSAIYDSGGALHYNGAAVGGGGGISNVVEDTTPQLGGDLDAQTNKITFTDGNVTIGDTVTAASAAATGNVIIGQRAGATGLGRDNIAIGHQSLNATAGNNDVFNVGIGYNSLQNADGDYNVALGTYAGQGAGGFYAGSLRRATKNICIGYYAGKDVLGNNNIEISPYNSTTSVLGNANYNDYLNIGHTIFADMANRRVNIGLIGSLSSWVLQSDAALYVRSESTTDISLLVEAKASQSASLQEWWDSSDTKLLAVGPDGGLELPSNTPSTTTNKLYNDGSKLNFDGAVLPESNPVAGASGIHNMMIMSQATYDALGTKDPNTLYYIV